MNQNEKSFSKRGKLRNVSIHVHGGNVQVLPNATHSVQYIVCTGEPERCRCDAAELVSGGLKSAGRKDVGREKEDVAVRIARGVLGIYYPEKKDLDAIIRRIADCSSASELANLVVYDMQENTILTPDRMVSKDFIESLRQFLTFKTGSSTGNIRTQINNAMQRRREAKN